MRRSNLSPLVTDAGSTTLDKTRQSQVVAPLRTEFRRDILAGLSDRPRRLSSVYFYDDRGSELFDQITRLPEYYLTRTEHEILTTHADAIIDLVGNEPCCVVDLGAGSGDKSQVILKRMRERNCDVRYAPIDVSAAALWTAEQTMLEQVPGLRIDPVHDDYIAALTHVRKTQVGRRLLVLWLGSSIGNFDDTQAVSMLRGLAEVCHRDDVLFVGFDLLKDPSELVAAYADSQGVTAEFNFNLLRRINRELSADFDVDQFAHHASFSPSSSRMESYLISRKRQTVTVAGRSFELDAWEPIRTEVSCKYSERRISELLRAAGLGRVATFNDSGQRFADVCCTRAAHVPGGAVGRS